MPSHPATPMITSLPTLISTVRSLIPSDRSDPSPIRLVVDSRSCGGREEIERALRTDGELIVSKVEWDDHETLSVERVCGGGRLNGFVKNGAIGRVAGAVTKGLIQGWEDVDDGISFSTRVGDEQTGEYRVMDLGWIPSDDLYRDDSNPTVVFEVADLREVDMAKVGRLLGPGFDVKLVLILDIVRHSPSSPHFKLSFHQYFLHAQTTTLLHHPHANFTYDSENPTDLPKVELSIDALLGTNLPGALLEYDVTRQVTLDARELGYIVRDATVFIAAEAKKWQREKEEAMARDLGGLELVAGAGAGQ